MIRKIMESYIENPHGSQLTIAVTNIGRVNISDVYGDLEVEEISFVASNAIFSRVLTVSAATFDEKMFLNFTASKPSISQDTIETLANSVINCLAEVCQKKVVMAVVERQII